MLNRLKKREREIQLHNPYQTKCDTYRLSVKRWEKIFPANDNKKKKRRRRRKSSGNYICIRQNRLKNKNCKKKNHYIIIKGSIHQGDITIAYIYAPNIRTPRYK